MDCAGGRVDRGGSAGIIGLLCFLIGAMFRPDARAEAPAATPPMGWNSWDAYGFTLDEATFKQNAVVLAGLRRYGWQYAVIDEGWYMSNPGGADREMRGYQLDGHGRLIPAPNRFPSAAHDAGLRTLADWTHSQGLKLGIHIVRGIPKGALPPNGQIAGSRFHIADAADLSDTCPWDDGNYGVRDNAAGQAYYDSVIRLYADWKVDFLKVDCISNAPYRLSEIRQIAAAIRHAGRPMVLSLSPGPTDISHASEVARYAQMWRISNDIWDGWSFEGEFPIGIGAAFDKLALWNGHVGAGHWPDADMLPIGVLRPHPDWGKARQSELSPDEQQSQVLLWAIARSPLILGCNLTELDESTRALITNPRVINLSQGPWRSHPSGTLPAGLENIRVWFASQPDSSRGDRVVAMFNVGSTPATIKTSWLSLGIERPRSSVLNVITGESLAASDSVIVRLAPHQSAAYRLY
jgi:alpha-galactosidase